MNKQIRNLLITGVLITPIQLSFANELAFSFGAGYPFIVVPEVSLSNADNTQRWHINYKAGLDDGFSLGFEQAVFSSKHHALGAVVGAIGVREEDAPCANGQSSASCIVANIFDEETINGAAFTYGYYFSGLNSSGWHVKFEAGYGEGSQSKEKHTSASIRFGYQF